MGLPDMSNAAIAYRNSWSKGTKLIGRENDHIDIIEIQEGLIVDVIDDDGNPPNELYKYSPAGEWQWLDMDWDPDYLSEFGNEMIHKIPNSVFSNYPLGAPYGNGTTLSHPNNIVITGTQASWDAVGGNPDGYNVYLDNNPSQFTQNTYYNVSDFSTFKVSTVDDGSESMPSNEIIVGSTTSDGATGNTGTFHFTSNPSNAHLLIFEGNTVGGTKIYDGYTPTLNLQLDVGNYLVLFLDDNA